MNWERADIPLLSAASDERSKYSGQASTVVRSLALSILAIAWLFGGGLNQPEAAPKEVVQAVLGDPWLRASVIAAIICLLIDVVHYHWGALVWGRYSGALNEVLVNDDHTSSDPSPEVRNAWARVARSGLADNLVYWAERTRGAPRPQALLSDPFSTPVSEARWYLAHAEQSAGLGKVLGSRWSPHWMNASIGFMFWAKAILVLTSYLTFLVYLMA